MPCTQQDAKLLCSCAEIDTHRKINLGSTSLDLEMHKVLDELYEEYKDMFSLHQGDIGHTKLLTMYIHAGDHPTIM